MSSSIFILLAIGHLLFFALCLRQWQRSRSLMTLALALVLFGLFFDNAVVATGRFLGEGAMLLELNRWRFILHALLTPLLIGYGVHLASRLGVMWVRKTAVYTTLLLLMVSLIGLGVYEDIFNLTLVAEQEAGTLRYVNASSEGPPIPAILVIIVMIVLGAAIWRSQGWPILCLGSVLMFIFAAAGASNVLLANIGELFFAIGLIWTELRFATQYPERVRLRRAG